MASFLQKRLDEIREAGNYRSLPGSVQGVDFWSNDYLGMARTRVPGEVAATEATGATGSRSISGDADAWRAIEAKIANHHGHPAALVFNSGYTANLGLLSSVLSRTDTIFYDALMHASCRDGLRLAPARAYRFRHNDLQDLRAQLPKARPDGQTFVLTEGRFSMDGDLAPLPELAEVCREAGAHLMVDEAHSCGLEGRQGSGLVASHGLQDQVFATVVTYGKAFGAHGAAVLGSGVLRDYLVNTCRPFIYTTGPAPAQWAGIAAAYSCMEELHAAQMLLLQQRIDQFRAGCAAAGIAARLAAVNGPIQIFSLPGNAEVMAAEVACREAGLLVKGIRTPTVRAGQERLRICLHAFNTPGEVEQLVAVLAGLPLPSAATAPAGKSW